MIATILLSLLFAGLVGSIQESNCPDGVPPGFMILGQSEVAPPGYTATGLTVSTDLNVEPSWRSGTPPPGVRQLGPVTALDDKIYALGSFEIPSGKFDGSVLVFDTGHGTWTSGARMLQGRSGHQAVAVNARVYAIGGATYSGWSSGRTAPVAGAVPTGGYLRRADEYDPGANQWTARATMNIGRIHFVAAAANGKIYAIGGHVAGGNLTSSVEEYDPEIDAWALRAPMPQPKFVHSSAAINGRIYVLGEIPPPPFGQPVSTFEEYDPSADTWTTRPPTFFIGGSTCAVVNNRIYAYHYQGYAAAVYDPVLHEWGSGLPIQATRNGIAAVGIRGQVYALSSWGGPVPMSFVDVFDSGTRTLHVFMKE